MADLEEHILDQQAREMSNSIDFEVLADLLVKGCGWTRVDLERFRSNEHAVDITVWLHDHCRGNWKRNGCKFIFEQGRDATWFTLKWL